MIWFIKDVARFRHERQGLISLGAQADWLTIHNFRTDGSTHLVMDADIAVGDRIFEISLHYPSHFPATPPKVVPRGTDKSRWSSHQFGAGGELCLEFGPDNWTPDMTGVQMLESAQRLLSLEEAATPVAQIPSRHATTPGQSLRTTVARLVVTRDLAAKLKTITADTVATGRYQLSYRRHMVDEPGIIVHLDQITIAGETWQDKTIPAPLAFEEIQAEMTIARVSTDASPPSSASLTEFEAGCAALGLPATTRSLVLLRGEHIDAYWVMMTATTVFRLHIIEPQDEMPRLPEHHHVLTGKSVALVGCGSLGSKVATILSRCGVGSFYLVDDDILLPDNLVRQDLDWRDVGSHKVDALGRRIQYVNPSASVRVRRIQLAGQESAGTAESALDQIGRCDLIIDATANPNVLNLLAAVAGDGQKPLVWAEVFGGGIGGLVARARPSVEPSPPYMRRAIENWFAERAAPPPRATRRYEAGSPDDPLIADDADVSSIAAAAARMALDLLLNTSPSVFPHSVYAIGLAPGSVFSQPFETFPIEVGEHVPSPPHSQLSDDERTHEFEEIVKILEHK